MLISKKCMRIKKVNKVNQMLCNKDSQLVQLQKSNNKLKTAIEKGAAADTAAILPDQLLLAVYQATWYQFNLAFYKNEKLWPTVCVKATVVKLHLTDHNINTNNCSNKHSIIPPSSTLSYSYFSSYFLKQLVGIACTVIVVTWLPVYI